MLRGLSAMAMMLWGVPATVLAAPCTLPTSACAEWITVGGTRPDADGDRQQLRCDARPQVSVERC